MPNPHLSRVPREALPEWLQEAHDRSSEMHGDSIRIEVAGNAPEIMKWYWDDFYGRLFYTGRADVPSKELLRFRLSSTHGCAHCNRGNRVAALQAGLTEEQLDNVMNENAPCFDAKQRALLRLADQISLPNMHGELSADLYAQLREHFEDGAIYELGVVAAVLTGMAKFLFVYDLVEREPNCPIVPSNGEA